MVVHPDLTPQIEVTISPDLHRLLAVAREMPAAERPALVPQPLPEAAPTHWQRIRLRRDGRRPLIFDGAPIFSASARTATGQGEAEQSIGLFYSKSGQLVAQIAVIPPADIPAWPIHRCETVADTDAFANFVDNYQPSQCCDAVADQTETDTSRAIAQMEAAMQQMIARTLRRPHH